MSNFKDKSVIISGASRGIGLGLKEFKKATKEIKDEVKNAADSVSDDKNSD